MEGGLGLSEGEYPLGLEPTEHSGRLAADSGSGLLEDAVRVFVVGVFERTVANRIGALIPPA